MRWNVVIGGQLISKSFRGFRSTYSPGLFDKEGILVAAAIFILPFVVLFIFQRILPVFEAAPQAPEEKVDPHMEGRPAFDPGGH
jgi:hypothetical protein